jgi:hypothetical protein
MVLVLGIHDAKYGCSCRVHNRSEVRIDASTLGCCPAGTQGCQHMPYFLCSCDKLAAKLLIAK